MTYENEEETSPSRIRSDSVFYSRVVPGMLIAMGIIMGALIIIALGVLLGYVPFR